MSISTSAIPPNGSDVAATHREPRRPVTLSGFATLDDGSTFGINVLDLSFDGCKVDTPIALLPRLKLKLSVLRLGSLPAEVRWYADGHAGLRFSPTASSERDEKPRKNQRHAVTADVLLRRPGGQTYRTRVFDLAPTGCKVEFIQRPRLEERLWVKFDGLEALESTVRWVDRCSGGIQFVRPIYPAVFELLLARLQQ